jgi:hypothetical protein
MEMRSGGETGLYVVCRPHWFETFSPQSDIPLYTRVSEEAFSLLTSSNIPVHIGMRIFSYVGAETLFIISRTLQPIVHSVMILREELWSRYKTVYP